MRIDHVIYATGDLDAAAARVQAGVGMPAVGGGRHEGLGTHNRIVPLGGGYIELLAIADPQEAAGNPFGARLMRRLREGEDGLFAWAAAVDDVAPVAERLGLSTTTIAREGLSAHLAGLAEAMADPALPFFIARDPGIPDPGAGAPGPGITWLEVAGDPARVREWLGGAELEVRVVGGDAGLVAIGIGDRELRTG